jgi:hypothetical protein
MESMQGSANVSHYGVNAATGTGTLEHRTRWRSCCVQFVKTAQRKCSCRGACLIHVQITLSNDSPNIFLPCSGAYHEWLASRGHANTNVECIWWLHEIHDSAVHISVVRRDVMSSVYAYWRGCLMWDNHNTPDHVEFKLKFIYMLT